MSFQFFSLSFERHAPSLAAPLAAPTSCAAAGTVTGGHLGTGTACAAMGSNQVEQRYARRMSGELPAETQSKSELK